MIANHPKILIVAGEASGDSHAARLVAAIKEKAPQAEFFGIGGEAMAAQGVRLLCHASDLSVMGLSEVVGRLRTVLRALREVGLALKRQRPSLVILVDFPDFNFWVARLAKFYRAPVMYYISPQVWAWRTYRVRTIARLVNRMVVIFPFEEEFYRQWGVPVTYVGHPLLEALPRQVDRRGLLKKWGLDPGRLTLALLPGSRASEIERHLPMILAGARIIHQAIPEVQFILPLASTAPAELVEDMVGAVLKPAPAIKIIRGQSYEALAAAHLAVVASGTATVEAAMAATPTVIVYQVSPITFKVGRLLIRVPHVGMANLLAGERIFPELIQDDFTPARLAREVLELIADRPRLQAIFRGLARVIALLSGPGASSRAAQVAVELMND
ncbi:MAG: lipid-A-disaccharide synthase [Deltaproteobacteria bacterium]|nr:lipid-A-disaccharide synthase [Deltaproteobacteria bacterium]